MTGGDQQFATYFPQTFLSKQIAFTSVSQLSDEQRRSIPETGLLRSVDMCAASEEFAVEKVDYLCRDVNGEVLYDSDGLLLAPNPLPDLTRLIAVCSNHGLARVLIDIDAGENLAWELWGGWQGREPELWRQPLWARLDDWLVMIFDRYEPGKSE